MQLLSSSDSTQRAVESATGRHLSTFASEGLRTLVFAKAEVAENVAKVWLAEYEEAQGAATGRERLLALAADRIEVGLTLLGCSGIEDKLQEGVPHTINQLQAAGIKMWMLTGDKQETAVNVAYAARLIDRYTRVVVIAHPLGGLSSLKATRKLMASRYAEVQVWLRRRSGLSQQKLRSLAIVVDGAVLGCCSQD